MLQKQTCVKQDERKTISNLKNLKNIGGDACIQEDFGALSEY